MASMSPSGSTLGGYGGGANGFQFQGIGGGTQAPGSAAIAGGYNAALGALNNSLQLAGNTTSGNQMALGTQLNQNLGNIQQGLNNSGLANSTILPTENQAAYNTYNQGTLNNQNQGALTQMSAYNNLASTLAGGGQAEANYYSPFALQTAQYNEGNPNAGGFNIGAPGGGATNLGVNPSQSYQMALMQMMNNQNQMATSNQEDAEAA